MKARERELVRHFWSGTPLRSLAPLLAAIFFTFAASLLLVHVR